MTPPISPELHNEHRSAQTIVFNLLATVSRGNIHNDLLPMWLYPTSYAGNLCLNATVGMANDET